MVPLLEQVLAEPDNLAVRRVYADDLLERGDPRGEFIQVQLELLSATGERRPPLLAREKQLLKKHEKAWLGDLRQHILRWRWRAGFLHEITTSDSKWYMGRDALVAQEPLRRARITGLRGTPYLGEAVGRLAALSLPANRLKRKRLRELLESEQVQALRGLDLHDNPIGDEGLELLASGLPRLVELRLFRCGLVTAKGIEALLQAPFIPRLQVLELTANALFLPSRDSDEVMPVLGTARLGESALLDISMNGLDENERAFEQLIASPLPRLKLDHGPPDLHWGVPLREPHARLSERFQTVYRDRDAFGCVDADAEVSYAAP
jgi:uncharacterized protein (TIGR02996 family)